MSQSEDPGFAAIPVDNEWLDSDTRALFDMAVRPARFLAMACDVFTEVYDSADHLAAGELAGINAGRAVVMGYGFDPEQLMTFDGAFAMTPEVAIGLAERLMQAAILARVPAHLLERESNDD